MFKCPHCGATARTRTSKPLSEVTISARTWNAACHSPHSTALKRLSPGAKEGIS
mgnify:CR=1 FL=1